MHRQRPTPLSNAKQRTLNFDEVMSPDGQVLTQYRHRNKYHVHENRIFREPDQK